MKLGLSTRTQTREFELGEDLIDIRDPENLTIEFEDDRLYVNVNGITVLRVYGLPEGWAVTQDGKICLGDGY